MNRAVDVNADVGEGGPDEQLMPHLTSCSIACGGHTGDSESMRAGLLAGCAGRLLMGAHPGYPDREGFGRRQWPMPAADLLLSLGHQLDALATAARRVDVELTHVKAHGALYALAWRDAGVATTVARAVLAWSPKAALFCPPGSAQEAAAGRIGVPVVREVFADRRYRPDGTLVPRSEAGAVIGDPADLAEQLSALARLEFDTVCVHGDNPAAVELAVALPDVMDRLGWEIAPYPAP